jgi:hypothetical protein
MKRTSMGLGLVLFGIILITGCATGPSFKKVETIPEAVGLVYIYRPMSPIGSGVSYEVRADGVPLVTLLSGEYFVYYAQPGEVEFSARTESTSAITVDIKAGQTYYLKCTLSVGITVGRPQLVIVSPAIGESEVAGCKLEEGKTAKALTKSSYNLALVPKGPVSIDKDIVGSLEGSTPLSLVNGHEKSKVTLVPLKPTIIVTKTFDVDYKQLEDFVIAQLDEELRKKGAKIEPQNDNSFKFTVETVELHQGMTTGTSSITLRIEKRDGTWSKTYKAEGSSALTVQRAFNDAAHKMVITILKDEDFRKLISK